MTTRKRKRNRIPAPLTVGHLCPACEGTGADIARTLALPVGGHSYVMCRECNGNGLDPAAYFRWTGAAETRTP